MINLLNIPPVLKYKISSSKGVEVMVCGLDHSGSQPYIIIYLDIKAGGAAILLLLVLLLVTVNTQLFAESKDEVPHDTCQCVQSSKRSTCVHYYMNTNAQQLQSAYCGNQSDNKW